MEKTVKFEQYRLLAERLFAADNGGRFRPEQAERLHPLVLAYIGDSYFSLYTRLRVMALCPDKVRIIHNYSAKMVSATMQALALRQMEGCLNEQEQQVYRRGRNAKSTVPRSATIADYRASTGFEALLGYLFIAGKQERLLEICEQAFEVISREIGGSIVVEKSK